jgi:VCBS repeat protein/FG-GAP repeat protein
MAAMRARGRLLTVVVTSVALVLVVSAGAAAPAAVDPSFAPGAAFDAGLQPTDSLVADFNGDHRPDLAVANCFTDVNSATGDPITSSDVRVLLGDGAGGFQRGPAPPLPAGAMTCSLASADFDGGGAPDLAVAISSGQAVAILLGDGAGGFAAAPGSPVAVAGTPKSVVAADVSGDGRPDLVVPVADSTGRVTGIEILVGNGSGGFAGAPGSPVPILAGKSLSVAVADLTGDGKADLAVANTNRNEISLLRGDGTGRFAPAAPIAALRGPHAITPGDFDGNGKLDLAALTSNGVAILLGDGSGAFHAAPGSPVTGGYHLAVADLNGDGRSDLVTGSVSVRMATGGGRFRPAAFSPFTAQAGAGLATGDFDGDGRIDIAGLTAGAPYWPVGPRGSVVLLQTESAPSARPARALRARDAVVETRRPITALAADGNRFAACAGFAIAWRALGRTPVSFKGGEYGACYDIAVSADRVSWTQGTGCGNTSCAEAVMVGKLSGGKRRNVDEQENDCGAGPCFPTGYWISQLLGAGPVIAWNDWAVDCVAGCDEEAPPDFGTYRISGQSLQSLYGGKRHSVRHDSTGHPLLAVGGGRMAMQAGTKVLVLKPNGARVVSVDAPDLESVALSQTELAVAGRAALRLYDPANGHLRKAIPLGPNATLSLAGVTSSLAMLRGDDVLELVRLSDGAIVSLPLKASAAKGLVDAKLTKAGLFYAYNLAKGQKKGRIVFEPTSRLLARF